MIRPAGSRGFWHSARTLPARTPLRVKLIAAVLALVTAALAVISIAGIAVLRGYLTHQADQQLQSAVSSGNVPNIVLSHLLSVLAPENGPVSIQWVPSSGPVQQVMAQYAGFRTGHEHMVPPPPVHQGAAWLGAGLNEPTTVTASSGRSWRVVSAAAILKDPYTGATFARGTIVVGVDVTSVNRTIDELTVIDVIISCSLLVILAIFGVALIRSSLRPLIDIERTAEAIAAGDLGRRVPERDPRTEVGKLGRSLNTMLAQIESAFRARTESEEAARRSEDAARKSALAASRSEERMRRFVADASHELRTPLTAIRGFAEYYRQRGGVQLTRGPGGGARVPPAPATLSSAELDRLIERVEQEATRMGVLVDDMLLLARLDQERALDFRTVDLLAIAADALHDARVMAPERTINLTVGTPDAALVVGDEVRLRQVVGNLMSNALTHTPDSTPIDITIRSGTLGSGPGGEAPDGHADEPAVILEVADTGPGLTEDQKEHVFERFYRTDRARTRTAGGTGLGLAIVAALVDAHHGRVWVESEPGKGATFGFALPLAPEARPATAQ